MEPDSFLKRLVVLKNRYLAYWT